ncbi:GNAT family N-acetyltransferase [Phocaeicola plebeius]|jgi:hypothetical protein|uniref:GNAT family N-acetyltransferase n=1 Tax=Phocaeicola plebeius TaxID=310297 RepID=UPI00195E2CA8|nr:GNAT family N-acetyltransferase [Phocaeicola plebeius]MBM6843002.1 GNAT family N-acetyltransferase [Phocaeicola plebeius]
MKSFITPHWNKYLTLFQPKDTDIYYKEEYVYLYTTHSEQPMCLVVEENDKYMLFPFLKREFIFHDKKYSDFETPYGYGGPIFNTNDEIFKQKGIKCLYDTFVENNYIAGFIRFHPLLNNYKYFDEIGQIIFDRKTIAINLSLSEEEIWSNEIHTKNRNIIKKGIKNGLQFIVDNNYNYYNQFIDLYNSTMDKLQADKFYYFPEKYYLQLKENIKNSFLGIVKKDDNILSAAIFFYNGPYGHYHLSGSNKKYLSLSPNNFMLYEAAKELKRRGALLFHLGGGTSADEHDSLFCFKSRFSKSMYQFTLGKLIFNQDKYSDLCTEWELKNPEKENKYQNFLLKYKY